MLILMLATRWPGGPAHALPLVFAGFIVFNFMMNAGPNSTTFTLAPELFPTQMRASAGGLAASVAKMGATLGVFAFPILKSEFGVPFILVLMAAVSVLALVVAWGFAREINEGSSLEDYHRRPRAGTGPDRLTKIG